MRDSRMTPKQIIEVLQAYERDESLQYRRYGKNNWIDTGKIIGCWNFETYEFRIKAEPKVIYVNEYSPVTTQWVAFSEKQVAIEDYNRTILGANPRCAVKYQEVIEPELPNELPNSPLESR